jgi:hypothetical protein
MNCTMYGEWLTSQSMLSNNQSEKEHLKHDPSHLHPDEKYKSICGP